MISYSLICAKGHAFDSWFADSAAYDALEAAGALTCAVCNGGGVKKAIMAPSVASTTDKKPLSAPATAAETALTELRKEIEANSENVGQEFASEARKIHNGESEQRAIYGEATLGDAKSLKEDGIPIAPLPWSNRRTN